MSSLFDLKGQTAVVTGASQGIGEAIAVRLSDAGARVHIGDIRPPQDGRFTFTQTDVSDENAVAKLMREAVESFGPINILVNNAGIHVNYDRINDAPGADFDRCFEVNSKGVVFGMKCAEPLMAEGGSIINISSVSGLFGVAGMSTYAMSKAAVLGLTRTAAIEYASRRIRVNAICPGSVRTPMAEEEGGEALLAVEAIATPLGRICEPEEVAALVHFLAAPDCSFITGQIINICGGLTAGLGEKLWNTLLEHME